MLELIHERKCVQDSILLTCEGVAEGPLVQLVALTSVPRLGLGRDVGQDCRLARKEFVSTLEVHSSWHWLST